jgi:hypothetical protein
MSNALKITGNLATLEHTVTINRQLIENKFALAVSSRIIID